MDIFLNSYVQWKDVKNPIETVEHIFFTTIKIVLNHQNIWYPQRDYLMLIFINKQMSAYFLILRFLKKV